MKYLIVILIFLSIWSCETPVHEFPYPDYLGKWRDSISGTDFSFSQSEVYIGLKKYQFWDVENDTLKLSQEPSTPPVKTFVILKEPYLDPKYKWRMVLSDGVKFYLKKL